MRTAVIVFLGMTLVIPMVSSSAGEKIPFREVTFPSPDGGVVSADLYGSGDHGVVLAHGRIFDKKSWQPLALRLAEEGVITLAIDFRGYGSSKAGKLKGALYNDVLGAVSYLHDMGVREVSVIGGSMGGGAAARAAVESEDGDIDRLILLSPVPIERPEAMQAAAVFYVVSREERLFAAVKSQYEKAPEPKRLEILEGDAHAQHIFKTDLGPGLTKLILEFLRPDEER